MNQLLIEFTAWIATLTLIAHDCLGNSYEFDRIPTASRKNLPAPVKS